MKLAWKNGWAIFVRLRSFSLTIGIIIFVFHCSRSLRLSLWFSRLKGLSL